MKVNRIASKKSANPTMGVKAVNRLPKKWRNRFEASLVLPGDGAKPAASKPDAEWVAAFFWYGLN